jgi:hypothetical protein
MRLTRSGLPAALSAAAALAAPAASAQAPVVEVAPLRVVIGEAAAEGGDAASQPGDNMVIVERMESFELALVRGAPYQAEAVTEMVQTLADGNRIVRQSKALVARDSEGRTRREHGLVSMGPLTAEPEAGRRVMLHDPVAGVGYVLDPEAKIARKLPKPPASFGDEGPRHERVVKRVVGGPGGPGGRGGPGVAAFRKRLPKGEEESLGTKTIEGVEVTGTRTTLTIAAGTIGNDKPIVIESERWYAPELKAVVQSRHSDPRFGETTYRLTNLSRGEPDHALFEVPSDFTVKEDEPGEHVVIEKVRREPKP